MPGFPRIRSSIPILLFLAVAVPSLTKAQVSGDPFPAPIPATDGAIRVGFENFAVIPDVDGAAPRVMHLEAVPGTNRIFVLDMQGPIYHMGHDGSGVTRYLDVDDPRWGVQVEATGRERGVQSFAFHPQFAQAGTPGYGRFYIWTDSRNLDPAPDYRPEEGGDTHDTVLLEFTAGNPSATAYDGGAPRELLRKRQPYGNHNGGQLAFNPLAGPGDEDFGRLYIGSADGGSGGDPLNLAQDLSSIFGKLLLIDPLASDGPTGEYGIPAGNPYAGDDNPNTLGEIYAVGLRNPQRFAWDPANGNLFVSDIGQNTIEEINLVRRGDNLGWNVWEGSHPYVSRDGVETSRFQSDPAMVYPVAEYDHVDPILQPRSAVSGAVVYRGTEVPQLNGRVLWGELVSGEIFHFSADNLPSGGGDSVRRVLFRDGGQDRTLLELIQGVNVEQGREPAGRTDMRMSLGPDDEVLVFNKYDGIVRKLVR
ncbi:MAG: PQQ-dependent sugar dehydrogenase [Gemmatimonadota bacterium]